MWFFDVINTAIQHCYVLDVSIKFVFFLIFVVKILVNCSFSHEHTRHSSPHPR